MVTPASANVTQSPSISADVPRSVLIISTALSMISVSILVLFLFQRVTAIRNWSSLAATNWLVFGIYVDSIVFVLLSAVLSHGWGVNSSAGACDAAILLCLVFYLTTKLLIYCFLVEKVFVIHTVSKSRTKSKLYLFNCFGVLIPFVGVIVLNFVFRIHRFRNGTCIIGMERKVILPLIFYDLVINIWLTSLFVIPLRHLYSYKNNPKSKLRTVSIRAFFGSCLSLTSSIVNLSIIAALRGEPAWVCLMCCNSDILFNTIVIHWVTSRDPQSSISFNTEPTSYGGGTRPATRPRQTSNIDPVQPLVVTTISALQKEGSVLGAEDDRTTRGREDVILGKINVRTDHKREEVCGWGGAGREDDDETSRGSSKDMKHQEPMRLDV